MKFCNFSRNTRSTSRRMPSSAQNQDSSEISSNHLTSTRSSNLSTTSDLSSNSNSTRPHQHTTISPVSNNMLQAVAPYSFSAEDVSTGFSVQTPVDTNPLQNGRERTNEVADSATRENGRSARSASASRRRNRRRRRRARSAGNANSNRTNAQNIDQNELQRTSLAGNYNLPRSSTTNNHCSSANVNLPGSNRTNSSSTVTGTLEGPEEEATKCQVNNIDLVINIGFYL